MSSQRYDPQLFEWNHSLSDVLSSWAERVAMESALITHYSPESSSSMRVMRYWKAGAWRAPQTYDMAGTPCEQVLKTGEPLSLPDSVAALFPKERGLIESYIGVPLFEPGGDRVLGHLAFADSHPHDTQRWIEPLIHEAAPALQSLLHAEWQMAHDGMNALHQQWLLHETVLSISEQLNQPMTAIQGYAMSLPMTLDDNAVVEQTTDKIKQNIHRAEHIMRRFKQHTMPTEETPQRVAVYDVLYRAIAGYNTQHINLFDDIDPLIAVYAPPRQLMYVFWQIISNSIRAEYIDNKTWRISVYEKEQSIIVDIEDNAIASHEPHDEWLNAYSGSDDKQYGMGLTIVRSLLERMSGSLHLKNTHPGTLVRVKLPKN